MPAMHIFPQLATIGLKCNHVKAIVTNVRLNVFISRRILFQTLAL